MNSLENRPPGYTQLCCMIPSPRADCPEPEGLLTIPAVSAPSANTQESSPSLLHEKTQVQRGILGVPEIIFSQLKQLSLHHTELLPAAREEEQE